MLVSYWLLFHSNNINNKCAMQKVLIKVKVKVTKCKASQPSLPHERFSPTPRNSCARFDLEHLPRSNEI